MEILPVASPPWHHCHRRLPGTALRYLPTFNYPPSGPPLSWPARFWWHYPPPRWISSGIIGRPELYPLWRGRPVHGRHSVLKPLAGGPRSSPRFHTVEGLRRIPPVLWGGVLGPQCHWTSLGTGRPGRRDLGLFCRTIEQYLEQASTPV